MLCVTTGWRFGVPKGLFPTRKRCRHHAGDIETSLMLHFRPRPRAQEKVANSCVLVRMENEFSFCARPACMRTLDRAGHPSGRRRGRRLAARPRRASNGGVQAERFIELLRAGTV